MMNGIRELRNRQKVSMKKKRKEEHSRGKSDLKYLTVVTYPVRQAKSHGALK